MLLDEMAQAPDESLPPPPESIPAAQAELNLPGLFKRLDNVQ